MKPFVILISGLLFISASGSAQTVYSLKECIEIAQKNNIVAQRAELNAQGSEIAYKSASYARMPNLNSSAGNSYNFGRTIDPFTNAFINQNVTAVSLNLSSSVTLFNGFRLKNNVASASNNMQASELNVDAIMNNVALDVAALYLSALMTAEQVKTFENNIKQTTEQLERINVLLDAGATTIDRKYELEAQLANDEFQLVNAKNNAQLAILNLKIYMNVDYDANITVANIETLDVNIGTSLSVDVASIINENFTTLPEVQRDELLLDASEYDLSAAQGNKLPSIFLQGNLNSLYSSRSLQALNPRIETFEIGYVEGTLDPVLTAQQVFDYSTPNFFNQVENNFGQTFGLTMSIPIYNRYQISAGIENAKINNQLSKLQLENTKNQVQNNIYQSYLALQAAEKAYNSAQKAFDAQEALLKQTELRYNSGAANYFDYLTVRNNYTNAEVTLMRSKYDLIFKEKSFGFYLGQEISL